MSALRWHRTHTVTHYASSYACPYSTHRPLRRGGRVMGSLTVLICADGCVSSKGNNIGARSRGLERVVTRQWIVTNV
eukprot:907393-Pyramimonas_sp.AAC.1